MTCKYYHEFTYCEPPMEPDENGTPVTEYQCKNAKGHFEATCCGGNTDACNLPEEQQKIQVTWPVYFL